jgi:protein SCO1/2
MRKSFPKSASALPSLALLGASLLLAACGKGNSQGVPVDSACTSRAYAEIGGPFALTRQDGVAVTQDDFKGRHTLVYFGFTYCPDVCPMTLVTVRRALELLPEGKERPQTVLISIDPERDTPEALAAYTASNAFPKGLIGLTGTPEAIKAAANGFRAGYNRVDDPGSSAGYTMDHTSIVYLMSPDWTLETFFTHEASAESMSACLGELL